MVQHSIIGAFGQAGQWEDAVATFRVLQEGEVINRLFSVELVFFRVKMTYMNVLLYMKSFSIYQIMTVIEF